MAVSADHRSEISLNAASSRGGARITDNTANIGRRRNRHVAGLPASEDLEEKSIQGDHQGNLDSSITKPEDQVQGSERMTRLRKRQRRE